MSDYNALAISRIVANLQTVEVSDGNKSMAPLRRHESNSELN